MLSKLFGSIDSQADIPQLVPSRCLRNRYRASSCSRCEQSCPQGAITIPRTVMLDGILCSGCLACVAACPTEALEPPSQASLLFRKNVLETDSDKIAVACVQNHSVRADLAVECLAVFSLHDLAALILTAKTTDLHLEYCAECPRSGAIENLRLKVTMVSGLFRIPAGNVFKLIEKNKVAGSLHGQRRAFFQLLKKSTLCAAAQHIGGAVTPPTAKRKNRHVPKRLQFLQQAMSQVKQREHVSVAVERLFPSLVFARHCDFCAKCVAACPTGALKKSRIKSHGIQFEKSACCGCGLCVEFCPIGAVSISSSLI